MTSLCRRLRAHPAEERVPLLVLRIPEIDRAPGVAFEAGVEQSPGIIQRSAFGKSQLHDALVGLPGADHPVVRPDRHASPFPVLDDLGIGLSDESPQP